MHIYVERTIAFSLGDRMFEIQSTVFDKLFLTDFQVMLASGCWFGWQLRRTPGCLVGEEELGQLATYNKLKESSRAFVVPGTEES